MGIIRVIINGKEQEIDANSTIESIIKNMQARGPMVVVEKNLEIIPKDQYNLSLFDGDSLEIVGFCGGG